MTHAQRDQAWVKICEELESALALSPAPAADLSSNKPDHAAAPLEDINGDAIAARNAKDSVEAAVAKKSPDVELDRATSTKVGTGLKPEDHIQRAQTSWREARRDYESLGVNTENQRTRIDALYRWKDSAEDYFSKQADAFFVKQPRTENSWNESYAERVLNELADHHATIGQAARQLGIDPRTLVPPFIKFIELQACLREKEPQIASALRNRFIEVGLPTYGFEKEEKTDSKGLKWRWFVVGCLLLLFAFGLTIWGFSLGTLSGDQRRLLVWALPLASGFSASAFAGSIFAKARNWIPGIVITATGGFGVWLITFFFLFPASKVEPNPPSSSSTASSTLSNPEVGKEDVQGKSEFFIEDYYTPSGKMGDTGDVQIGKGVGRIQQFVYTTEGKGPYAWEYRSNGMPSRQAGVMYLDPPNNWGMLYGGQDLRGFRSIVFGARSLGVPVNVVFVVGGVNSVWDDKAARQVPNPFPDKYYIRRSYQLTTKLQPITIPLDGPPENLQRVIGGFGWMISWESNGIKARDDGTPDRIKTFTIEISDLICTKSNPK